MATESFAKARDLLSREHVCVIAGSPGVGKTMLAHAMVADAAKEGFDIYEINSDVRDAWRLYDPSAKQFFIYDDFLGQISLRERLEKNEDKGIVRFMEAVASSEKHRFVLTTREYILREATSSFTALKEIGERRRFLLKVPNYSQSDRAKILYNHVWHSKLEGSFKAQFAQGGWKEIVDHHGFNPRLIQYATGDLLVSRREHYLEEFVAILDRPTKLWEEGYDHQIREEQRVLLRVLCSFNEARIENLVDSVVAHGVAGVQLSNRTVLNALRELDQTFISVRRIGSSDRVKFHSPAVREFVLELLRTDRHALLQVVESAQSIDQLLHLYRAGLATTETNSLTGKTVRVSSAPLPLREIREPYISRLIELFEASSEDSERALAELSSLEPYLAPGDEWWSAQLQDLSSTWQSGDGELEHIETILTSNLIDSIPVELAEELISSARIRVAHFDFEEPHNWTLAANILEDVLGDELPWSFGENFFYFVQSGILTSFSERDFGDLREVASRIGHEQAERFILGAEAEQFGEPDWDYEREARYSGAAFSNTEPAAQEFDDLFDRFRE
ncbi:ATP-binding protein [Mycetocola sp. JXN-3]|uniref:ATP-binding protein n=1 Tax=Mycetocola sp. JXN-3 TaxID=2116510 RepID=UPI00165D0BD8|nr:ATP-binding protein [Mycetocola sp. JXN-3]